MKELYDLKEMLCKELKEYGEKGEMTAGTLDVVDKLAHTVKNLDKIIEVYEDEGYSGHYPYNMGGSYDDGMNYRDGRSMRGSYDGGSYARGRRNARRDTMGRYSRESYRGGSYGYSRGGKDEYREQLMDMLDTAPDEQTRQSIQRMIDNLK